MRRTLLIALPALLLAGCAGLGGPRTITLSEADIARRLEREFPMERRMLEVFDVRVESPRVTLLPERNRLAADLGLVAAERLLGRRYGGRLSVEGALRYDAAMQAVRLADVRVDSLRFDGIAGAPVPPVVERVGALLAEQLLDGLPIYRFRPEDLQRAQAQGLRPGDIAITGRGVELTLVPVP